MDIYRRKTIWKFLLLIFAVIIGLGSLLYTQNLVNDLKNEERKKAELLARTWRRLINSREEEESIGFLFSIIENNTTISPKDIVYCAAQYGNLKIIKYLVKDKKFPITKKAIRNAAENDHFDVVKYLSNLFEN